MPGQLISPSLDVTVPLPVPAGFTVSVNRRTLKVAVTDRAPFIVTVQVVLVVVQLPLHPPNVDPLAALAVSVTTVPLS